MYSTLQLCNDQLAQLVASEEFTKWLDTPEASKEGYVVFNNSFQKREKSNTVKHTRFLAVEKSGGHERPVLAPIKLVEEVRLNRNYGLYAASKVHVLGSLEDLLTEYLEAFGMLAFYFIGTVEEAETQTIDVGGGNYHITFDAQGPEMSYDLATETVKINNLIPVSNLVRALKGWATDGTIPSVPDPENFAAQWITPYENLRRDAYSKLRLPRPDDNFENTLLDAMISAMESAFDEYKRSLIKWKETESPEQYNNILRLSYNFSEDAGTLLRFVQQLSDIKPIILFTTIYHQWALSNRIKPLASV